MTGSDVLYTHYICLCHRNDSLDLTIESSYEDKEEAARAVLRSLGARYEWRRSSPKKKK